MQYFDLAQLSLAKRAGSSVTEMYIPLWSADGAATSMNGNSSGAQFVMDGSTSSSTSSSDSRVKLFTLSSTWSSTMKYAFEITAYSATSGQTVNVALWDLTAAALVSSSQIALSNTAFSVLRSGQFTLTPGHSYAITGWNSSGYTVGLCDASLIVFP